MGTLNDIYEYVRSGETEKERLGLEIEHFIINEVGVQITFEEVTPLIEKGGRETGAKLLYVDGHVVGYAKDKYSVTLEPSCQFEISINPYAALDEIEKIYREFRDIWDPIFAGRGYHFVAKGNLPLVECGIITPDEIPLSPKKRYEFMDVYLRTSGKYGKYMMRASASTQVSIDYKSETDLIRKLRVLEKLSPIFMIMMENKTEENSALPGAAEKPHLLRIQEWEDLDPARTGFYPGSFDEGFGYAKVADVVYHTPLILLTDNDVSTYVGSKTAEDLFAEHMISEDGLDEERRTKLVEHFLSMGFFHFRIKKYIEVRVADSVPIKKALGYTALLKGIVYSERNLDALEKELADIKGLEEIQDAVEKIEAGGDSIKNTHPFARYDISGRQWVLAHNGTIFDSEALAPYRFVQEGSTDSERILLYIIDRMGETYRRKGDVLSADERIRIIEDTVQIIVPGNKVNLLIYDGELFYVHKNERGTLHQKELEEGMLFATQPLTEDGWEEFPQNQLMVYRDGDLVYAGNKHDHTYVHNEERMQLLYLAYAGL